MGEAPDKLYSSQEYSLQYIYTWVALNRLSRIYIATIIIIDQYFEEPDRHMGFRER